MSCGRVASWKGSERDQRTKWYQGEVCGPSAGHAERVITFRHFCGWEQGGSNAKGPNAGGVKGWNGNRVPGGGK